MISAQSKAIVIESVGIDATDRNTEVAVLTAERFVVVGPVVLSLPADGFVDAHDGVFARIYNTDGTAWGETIQVNRCTPGLKEYHPGAFDTPSYLLDAGAGRVALVGESSLT